MKLIFLALLVFSQVSYARLLRPLYLPDIPIIKSEKHRSFLAPNESQPQNAIPILMKAPKGILVSVGTERGFMTASITPNINGLLLLDYDPNVVEYNRINIALLQMSKNREEYIYLRLQATHEEWVSRLKGAKVEDYLKHFISISHYQDHFRDSLADPRFATFHNENLARQVDDFVSTNYLFNDKQFQKLKWLADSGRIEAVGINLTDIPSVKKVANELKHQKLKISVLDLSNAWQIGYISLDSFADMINTLSFQSSNYSLLLLTDTYDYNSRLFSRNRDIYTSGMSAEDVDEYMKITGFRRVQWNYYGFYLHKLDYMALMKGYFVTQELLISNAFSTHPDLIKNAINTYYIPTVASAPEEKQLRQQEHR